MLVEHYNQVKNDLQPQIQGTCGIYSFYTAVRILRDMNSANPAVPPPKKSQATATDSTATTSLREYAKVQLLSGQGEILTENEMMEFVAAQGYAPLSFDTHGDVSAPAKKSFIDMCMEKGYPVLVPYLADQVGIEMKYITALTANCGAHWSLIIGTPGGTTDVVEPNAPRALKSWPFDDLMTANSLSDRKKFARHWAKQVYGVNAKGHAVPPSAKNPGTKRGINPIPDIGTWKPRADEFEVAASYDLGGADGARQDKQNLNHVLIAIVPPHEGKK